MAEYIFVRGTIPDGRYDIDNPLRVDAEGNQIHLAKEIEAAITGKSFKVVCSYDECKVITETDWTSEEQTTLGQVVQAHKDNT